MRVDIAAGGTGGHFYPGLAVAKALAARGDRVRFIVRRADYVRPLLERDGLPFIEIFAAGFSRSLTPKNFIAIIKLCVGTLQCLRQFIILRPDALLVMGGYLSAPAAVAARLLGIPAMLHEQNVRPGLANRLVARLARKVAISFEPSRRFFAGDVTLTGNPVRQELQHVPSAANARKKWNLDPSKPTLLVFGGSLGAKKINEWMIEAVLALGGVAAHVQIAHLTGPSDEQQVRDAYAKARVVHYVAGYCHDMPNAYAAADLVICRAGASTVSELLAVRKPAFLIPYPFATENHQVANAEVLARLGAARIYEERNTTADQFTQLLRETLADFSAVSGMAAAYSKAEVNPFLAAGAIVGMLDSL